MPKLKAEVSARRVRNATHCKATDVFSHGCTGCIQMVARARYDVTPDGAVLLRQQLNISPPFPFCF